VYYATTGASVPKANARASAFFTRLVTFARRMCPVLQVEHLDMHI